MEISEYPINPLNDDSQYRNCVSEKGGNCKYMKCNEQGTPTCSLDGTVQVEFNACTPDEIKNKSAKPKPKPKNQNKNQKQSKMNQKHIDNALVYAARYAHTRKTGAALQVVSAIIAGWHDINPHTQQQLIREARNEATTNPEDWARLFALDSE